MSNRLFLTFISGANQYVTYWGKASGTGRLDLHHHMKQLGFDSSIIEVDGKMTKEKAYAMAKTYATKYGLPVITDKEQLEHIKRVNAVATAHSKEVMGAIRKLSLPKELKTALLQAASDVIEKWVSIKQEVGIS